MRRCAFRGNKKAKYYSVAAILYLVFIGFCILPATRRSKPAARSSQPSHLPSFASLWLYIFLVIYAPQRL